MIKGKKYDFRIEQDGDVWKADIIRKVTSKRTVVSKSQTGFTSEAEARAWSEKELVDFLKHHSERNKRRRA